MQAFYGIMKVATSAFFLAILNPQPCLHHDQFIGYFLPRYFPIIY